MVFEQHPILVGRIFHPGQSHGCCPVRATGGSLPCGRYILAPLTGNKEGSMGLMVLQVKPTPTRFPTNSLNTPMDNTPFYSVPWGRATGVRITSVLCTSNLITITCGRWALVTVGCLLLLEAQSSCMFRHSAKSSIAQKSAWLLHLIGKKAPPTVRDSNVVSCALNQRRYSLTESGGHSWCLCSNPSWPVGFSTQCVAQSAPQRAHYHVDVDRLPAFTGNENES